MTASSVALSPPSERTSHKHRLWKSPGSLLSGPKGLATRKCDKGGGGGAGCDICCRTERGRAVAPSLAPSWSSKTRRCCCCCCCWCWCCSIWDKGGCCACKLGAKGIASFIAGTAKNPWSSTSKAIKSPYCKRSKLPSPPPTPPPGAPPGGPVPLPPPRLLPVLVL